MSKTTTTKPIHPFGFFDISGPIKERSAGIHPVFEKVFERAVIDGRVLFSIDPGVEPPTIQIFRHPFLNNDTDN